MPESEVSHKSCTKCNQSFPHTSEYFTKDRRRKDHTSAWCRHCHHIRYIAMRSKIRELAQKRRAIDPEREKEKRRNYRKAHAQEIRSYQAEYSKNNKERTRKTSKAWKEKNKEHIRKMSKEYVHPDPLRKKSVQITYRRKRRAWRTGALVNDFTTSQWQTMQAAYGHRCVYCGKRYKGKLSQDHISPISKGGNHTLSNIVPACKSCNSRKHAKPAPIPIQPLLL